MLTLTLRLVATALGLSGLIAATTLPVRAQLYAEAKSEGAFVFYVGGPTAPWEAKAKVFEQRYPGIKVSITGGFSNVLDKKIDQLNDYRDFLTNETQLIELRKRFEHYTGPVVNVGGVR